MAAKVLFRLTIEGQKADLLKGGSGEQVQHVVIDRNDPLFAEAVSLGNVTSAGDVQVDRSDYQFDSPPTVAEVLQAYKDRDEEQARKTAADIDSLRQRFEEVLAEKRVTSRTVSGVWGEVVYLKPDWPYISAFDSAEKKAVRDAVLAAASAWLQEIAAANDAATQEEKRLRQVYADNEEALKRDKEQQRREWNILHSLPEAAEAYLVKSGCLAEAPIWESHKRGKNWLAVITPSPAAPGGLERSFARRAKGDCFFFIDDIEVGSPVEFGADYYSGGGRKSSNRWYGVLQQKAVATSPHPDGSINVGDEFAAFIHCQTAAQACQLVPSN